MSERIAVIGSNSFSGSSFIRHCLEQGLEVFGASRSVEAPTCFLPYRWLPKDQTHRFRFLRADLNHDLDRLMSALDDFRPDYIVNFVAQGMVAQSWEIPEHWYQTNVVANVRFHDRLRLCSWLKKYVHVSTPEVYGSTAGRIDESAPFNPSTPYAASRAACDLHLRTFFNHYQFPVSTTRAANVYGPGQQLYRIIPRTILSIRLKRKLELHGGGRSVRSFIHIADVADATLRIARDKKSGENFHLATPENLSVRELVERICRLMGANFSDLVQIVGDRPAQDAAYLLDSTKARSRLGWSEQVALDDGLTETIQWFDAHQAELVRQPADYVHKP